MEIMKTVLKKHSNYAENFLTNNPTISESIGTVLNN